MKFSDLIKANNWLSVQFIFVNLYPDQETNTDAYANIFENLSQKQLVQSDIEIVLTSVDAGEVNEESYIAVSGKKKREATINKEDTESWALEFTPWNEWLGMEIEEQTCKIFSELEIISHCLYEMTFYGFDEEEIQAQMNDLKKKAEECENMAEEEKKENTKIPEDLFKELDDEES